MIVLRLAATLAILAICFVSGIAVSETANECKTVSCEKHRAINEAACSDVMPLNASCRKTTDENYGRCLRYCDEHYPVSEPPRAPDPRRDYCDVHLCR
jgi:hypothetical protein